MERHYLILNHLDQNTAYNDQIEETPFSSTAMEAAFPDFAGCKSVELRRFKAFQNGVAHSFLDLALVECIFSAEEAFRHFPLQPDGISTPPEFGLYEELQSVEWTELPMDLSEDEFNPRDSSGTFSGQSSSWGEYTVAGSQSAGTFSQDGFCQNSTGFILIAYETPVDFAFGPFIGDWHNWCAIRDLCESLPSKCTFRKIKFFRAASVECKCRYPILILLEVDNVKPEQSLVLNCVNNAQSLCFNRAWMALCEEVEFEIELDLLQRMVALGSEINCNGQRLVVEFGQKAIAAEKSPKFGRGFPTFCSSPMSSASYISMPQFGCAANLHSNDQLSTMSDNGNAIHFHHFMPRSGTNDSDWRFDAEMEEIEKPTSMETCRVRHEFSLMKIDEKAAEEVEPCQKICLNNNSNNNPITQLPESRKSSWRFIKNLFHSGSSTPTTAGTPETIQLAEVDLRNNNSGMDSDSTNDTEKTVRSARRKRSGKKSQDSLIRTIWRKISMK